MNKKAIFLDFDGTLTDGKFHIWKFLWKKSGYAIDKNSYYAKYKNSFLNKNPPQRQPVGVEKYDFYSKKCYFTYEEGL